MSRDPAPHLGLLLTVAIWGGAFIALKALLPPLGPLDWVELTWLRYGSASVLFLILAAAISPRALADLVRRRLGLCLVTGAFGVAGYNLALNYGESQVPATVALLIIPVNPVGTMILARLFLGERVTPARWLGSALAVAGLALVVLAAPRDGGGWGPHPAWGLLAVLGSALSWSVYTLLGKRLMAEAPALPATALSTALGTLPVLPLAFRHPDGFRHLASGGATAMGWMAYLVVLSTLAAFLLYLWGLKRLSAGTASSYIYLMPVFGLGWGRLVLGERVASLQLAGAAVLIAGVVLASGQWGLMRGKTGVD